MHGVHEGLEWTAGVAEGRRGKGGSSGPGFSRNDATSRLRAEMATAVVVF